MGRRELREEVQATWLVHEPQGSGGNRHARRARLVQIRRARTLREPTDLVLPEAAVESSEARRPPAPRDSTAASEGSK